MHISQTLIRNILILVVLIISPAVSYAININSKSTKELAQTYGFLYGQDGSLSRIEAEFPELSGQVLIVRSQFDAAFPNIKAKIAAEIRRAFGEHAHQKMMENVKAKLDPVIAQQRITPQVAADFLSMVKARANGEIDSPVLEYLLTVKYADNPAREMQDRFRQIYRTDGTGKSRGVRVSIQLPRSWLAGESERPHIVKKWVSENGNGMNMAQLLINDVPEVDNLTKAEVAEYLKSGEAKDAVPEGHTLVASGPVTVEKSNGYWVQISGTMERAERMVYQNMLTYNFFFRGKYISLMCSSLGAPEDKQDVDEAFRHHRPLCQQVLNTLVLPQSY
jgi:hypothetical protein